MRLLLDTHVLLWWLADDKGLSPAARSAIADGESAVFVSSASAWEIAIKRALGKLKAPSDLEAQLESNRFEPLAITISHAMVAGALPRHHDDPFDRMLVAQAMNERLTVVTHDDRFALYGVATLS
jgi:PIN domain nuclease of toxin-antitoxin system